MWTFLLATLANVTNGESFDQGYQQKIFLLQLSSVDTIGRFKTLKAINIAQMIFFQFCACLHMKHSIIKNVDMFKILQAISIALMFLFFQFYACFHTYSIIVICDDC